MLYRIPWPQIVLICLSYIHSCFAQERSIFRITASECVHDPPERTQTGFVITGVRGILTALHGVADAKHIGATNDASKEAFSSLMISKLDAKHDVALLDSPELDGKSLPGLTAVAITNGQDPGPLTAFGYPYGIDLISTKGLLLRGLVQLRSLIPQGGLVAAITTRDSPSYKVEVLSIQGNLLPGDSGAPMLTANDSVLGIGNGGLNEGYSGICWAIPIANIKWEEPQSALSRLRGLDANLVFFAFPALTSGALPPLANNQEEFENQFSTLVQSSLFDFYDLRVRKVTRPSHIPVWASGGHLTYWEGSCLLAGARKAFIWGRAMPNPDSDEETVPMGQPHPTKDHWWNGVYVTESCYVLVLGENVKSQQANDICDSIRPKLDTLLSNWGKSGQKDYWGHDSGRSGDLHRFFSVSLQVLEAETIGYNVFLCVDVMTDKG
jgi:Trypsin-like peptidase domain